MSLSMERYMIAKWRPLYLVPVSLVTIGIGIYGLLHHKQSWILISILLSLYYSIWWYDTIYYLRKGKPKS
jgi:hypothetical protein